MTIALKIVVPVYRSPWIERCIASIRRQSLADFQCVVIEDASPDDTRERLHHAVGNDARFQVIENEERRYQLENRLVGVRAVSASPDDVIVFVDGDDWLIGAHALMRIAREYEDPDVWLTYGSYRSRKRSLWKRLRPWPRRPSTRPYPADVLRARSFREERWWAGHPITFRRFLFDLVKDADLRDEDGAYYRAATEQALVMPMMEMAGAAHLRHIPDALYCWNKMNPLSADPAYRERQRRSTAHVRARPQYPLLERE